jgi:ABC-2 type transport system permease protein
MTFLQQTLGKNYKWWYILSYGSSSRIASPLGFFISQISSFLLSITIYFVWFSNSANLSIMNYLIIGRMYRALASNRVYSRFGNLITSGEISRWLLYPNEIFSAQFWLAVGSRFVKNIIDLIGYLLAGLVFFVFFTPIQFASPHIIFLCFLFIPVSFTILNFIGIVIGSAAFFINDKKDMYGVESSAEALEQIFTGSIIPLSLLPFNSIISFNPYAFVLHHPMQIYLGKYSNIEVLYTFLSGIAWCIALWILARVIFKLGLKKNEAVGL